MPQGKSSKELKERKGAITDKSSKTLENVEEDKEPEDIEDDHKIKTCAKIVAALEEVSSHLNKENSTKETQEVGENDMSNFVNKGTAHAIPLGYSNTLGNNAPQKDCM